MTIQTTFTDWRTVPPERYAYRKCSPALLELAIAMQHRYGTQAIGCYGTRPIRGTEKPSVHNWGAAIDISYRTSYLEDPRPTLCAYLVGWSAEWGIDAVHDYRGQRIWRAGRTGDVGEACTGWWRAQKRDQFGMGQPWADWLHVEVCMSGWHDDRGESERGVEV